jgi:ATP-dependent DNA ligase
MLRPRPLPPGFIEPCLPTASDRCKSGPDWVPEIKHDGYRLIARRIDDRVRLYTRRAKAMGGSRAPKSDEGSDSTER